VLTAERDRWNRRVSVDAGMSRWIMLKRHCLHGLNSTWLVTSRLDTTRSTCQAHAFWLARVCRTARLDTHGTTSATGSTRSTRRTCGVGTWRYEPNGIWAYSSAFKTYNSGSAGKLGSRWQFERRIGLSQDGWQRQIGARVDLIHIPVYLHMNAHVQIGTTHA